jgi:CO/xanthine dehydrogenase Mo-binding subunit
VRYHSGKSEIEESWEMDAREVVKVCYDRKVSMRVRAEFCSPDTSFSDENGQGNAYCTYSYTTHVAEVEVDLLTGHVNITQFSAAQDVGKALFPAGIEGQMEGGILQGIGYALYEDFKIEGGEILTENFSTYIIPTSLDVPEKIELALVEAPCSIGPFGAKGVGEPALIPAPAAIANAVSNALGIRFRSLPITPERILSAVYGKG